MVNNRVEALAATISRYIKARPQACDTLDGICDWWIPQQRLIDAQDEVLAALQLLIERGEMQARSGLDGQLTFHAEHQTSADSRDLYAQADVQQGSKPCHKH
ncbi:hypothetical protein DBR47_22265 [Paucibacter sp. KBW04]|uniref:hypothetical protein n=1 Tax=Paucibacter sp. KBW04 TaxID=2153361 RepID=UPI000F57B7AD|nr:hypothetical protein [Paucibacter sp. KBW04]RQO54794.1 hypothetical protein DBR47_22265 [Paucibacter sp. KBW04]